MVPNTTVVTKLHNGVVAVGGHTVWSVDFRLILNILYLHNGWNQPTEWPVGCEVSLWSLVICRLPRPLIKESHSTRVGCIHSIVGRMVAPSSTLRWPYVFSLDSSLKPAISPPGRMRFSRTKAQPGPSWSNVSLCVLRVSKLPAGLQPVQRGVSPLHLQSVRSSVLRRLQSALRSGLGEFQLCCV